MWVRANLSKTFEKTYTKLRLEEHDTEMGDRCQESHPRGKNKMKMLERKKHFKVTEDDSTVKQNSLQ